MSKGMPGVGYSPANDTLVAPGALAGGADGSYVGAKETTEELTLTGAAYDDSTLNLLPSDAWVVGVVTRVTASLNGETYDVGIAGDTQKFITGATGALGDTANSFKETVPQAPFINQTAGTLRLTHAAGASGGKVRVTVKYLDLSEPVS